jgi:hypothetical protein
MRLMGWELDGKGKGGSVDVTRLPCTGASSVGNGNVRRIYISCQEIIEIINRSNSLNRSLRKDCLFRTKESHSLIQNACEAIPRCGRRDRFCVRAGAAPNWCSFYCFEWCVAGASYGDAVYGIGNY